MLQFGKQLIAILVALGTAGCQAPHRPAARLTLIPETSDQTAPPTAPVSIPPPQVVEKSAPSAVLSFPSTNGWIALERWCLTNNLSKPQRQNHSTNISYALHTTNGIVTFTAGSRLANWNNLVCGLGFAPKLTNGELFIHSLDLKKNLLPLLVTAPNPVSTNRTIVIDPGHGGENTGTKSALSKAFEKQYTLDWAKRLEPLLRMAGWQVFFTRTNDVDVSLGERVAFADRVKADLFVSLHFNSLPAPSERSDSGGIETYCLTPVGMPSNLTRNYEDDRQKLFPNNAFDLQNFQYACRLHQAMIEATGCVDRGVRRARFMGVLREQNRPAVLLEGGYLSHPKEARLITTASYRQKLAEAVAKALTP